MELTLEQLAERIGATLVAGATAGGVLIRAVAAVDAACEHDITFATSDKHLALAAHCKAGAILVAKAVEGLDRPQLVVPSVDAALIEILTLFAPPLRPLEPGIHPSALVDPTVRLGTGVSIGPGVVIEADAVIGDHVILRAGVRIGQAVEIGGQTCLDCNVVVYHHCRIGSHVIIQANTTIGAMGFGYAHFNGQHRLVPHNGAVVIEDFVEIGANCCIDRAKFANTIVGSGTKMDNLVQIGHNVVIGRCCLLAAQVGIAGSSRIGDGVVLAGQVGLADNITVGQGVKVGAQSGVMGNIPDGQTVVWTPAIEQSQALRVVGEVLRLPKTAKRVSQLAKRLDSLEAAKDDKG